MGECLAYTQEAVGSNPTEGTKRCPRCKETKSLKEFHRRRSNPNGLQYWCKLCNRETRNTIYQNNRAVQVAREIARQQANRERVYQYLTTHPCVDCGEADPVVLEFDHVGVKTVIISRMFSFKWERILAEISQCEVRCANCHRRKTAKQLGWWKARFVV
jgi:hypothetical protein